MNSTRFAKPFVALAALALILVAGTVLAQPGHGRHGGPGHHGFDRGPGTGMFHVFEELELTDAQKEQIHELLEAQHENGEAARDAARTARATLHEAIHADVLDEAAIRAAAADVAALEADQAVARATVFQSIRQVLTAEQLAKLAEIKAKHAERREERMDRRGHRGPGSDDF
jgi:periplasmic protein CpxP/Spy